MSAYPDLIMDDEEWLLLREGDTATTYGKLQYVGHDRVDAHGITPSLIIRFTDWSQLVIECADTTGLLNVPLDVYAFVRVRRTEDGLAGIALWQQGGVPIPLETSDAPAPVA